MNVYGNTCPMCCGDLDAAHRRAEDTVCRFCDCDTEASAYAPFMATLPDVPAFNLGPSAINDLAEVQVPFRLNMAVA